MLRWAAVFLRSGYWKEVNKCLWAREASRKIFARCNRVFRVLFVYLIWQTLLLNCPDCLTWHRCLVHKLLQLKTVLICTHQWLTFNHWTVLLNLHSSSIAFYGAHVQTKMQWRLRGAKAITVQLRVLRQDVGITVALARRAEKESKEKLAFLWPITGVQEWFLPL